MCVCGDRRFAQTAACHPVLLTARGFAKVQTNHVTCSAQCTTRHRKSVYGAVVFLAVQGMLLLGSLLSRQHSPWWALNLPTRSHLK